LEWSYPWMSIDGDRAYDDSDYTQFFANLFTNGVSLTTADGLKVKENPTGGMRVQVAAGAAMLGGRSYFNSTSLALSVSVASSTQDRMDSIVIRMDKGTREIKVIVKTGDTSVTRTSDIYELQLATIKIPRNVSAITADLITDKRADTTVCGYSSPFEKVNVSGLEEQYEALLQNIITEMNQYSDEKKEKLETDIQAIIDKGNAQLTQQTVSFQGWFETIKGQLGEDAAGNLQNQINELAANSKFITITHGLNALPKVNGLYWEYGAGLVGAELEPTGAGGSNVISLQMAVEYTSYNDCIFKVPASYLMTDVEIIKISATCYRFISGYKTIQVNLEV